MQQSIIWLLYRAFTALVQPLLLFKLAWRARKEPLYAHEWLARFGYYGRPTQAILSARGKWVWVHAVSLGETMAAQVLIQALREKQPGMKLLLTHSTATGWSAGSKLVREGDVQTWLPWDSKAAVRRFLDYFQPARGLILETETWPVLCSSAAQAGIGLSLVNARMSEKSFQGFARLRALSRPVFAAFDWVGAQSEADAQRLRLLGAKRVEVVGNLKMDAKPDTDLWKRAQAHKQALNLPVIMLASSREGEEKEFLVALERLTELAAHILIVPRHPQRFDSVEQLALQRGWQVLRKSQLHGAQPWLTRQASSSWPEQAHHLEQDRSLRERPSARLLWLGDTMGEMSYYYGLSDAVLMGGSFAPLGGQNFIEAIACGCPVWVGPSIYNFKHSAQSALAAGALMQSTDLGQACADIAQRLQQPVSMQRLIENGRAFLQMHQGASQRYAERIFSL